MEHAEAFKERQRIITLLENEIEKNAIIEQYNYTAKKVLSELKRGKSRPVLSTTPNLS